MEYMLKDLENKLRQNTNNLALEKEKILKISVDVSKLIDNIFNIMEDMNKTLIDNYIQKNNDFKFQKITKNKNKAEIIQRIKTDILESHIDISIIELNIIASNIYEYCCLSVNDMPEEKICSYLLYKNNYYNDILDQIAVKTIASISEHGIVLV